MLNTINKIKVRNMDSLHWNSNSKVVNQFIITTPEGEYFQSYDSIIVFVPKGEGKTVLDETYWNYSVTTSKYRNNFLGEDTKTTKQKIKDGIYTLQDLN